MKLNTRRIICLFSLLLLLSSIGNSILWASPQTKEVSGVIRDSKNNTVPGVSVVVKGTTIGTTSDLDGRYSIQVPDSKSILVFSFVGFINEELAVGSQSVINVSMKDDAQLLEEVVVVGYGVQRKSDVTGAVSQLSATEMLETPAFNALQGMRGKVAGVNVFTNSGSPSGSNRVLIRGVGTINSKSDPLYVVDGVVMQDFQFMNPNDIESMEVLKDASATAIYGARGANGVILVSTKRGKKGESVSVSYDGYMTISTLRNKMDVLNANEFMEVLRIGYANAPLFNDYKPGEEPIFEASDPRLFNTDGSPKYNTDWQEESTRTTISHNHQISVQGGSEKSSVGAFLNYSDNQGIMLNSYMKRLNSKVTYDVTPKDWFTFGINIMVNKTWENAIEEDGGGNMPRRTMIEMAPIFPVRFPDTGLYSSSRDITNKFDFEAMANPVHVLETQKRERVRTQIFGNAALTFHLLPGLDLKTQFGVDNQQRRFDNYSPSDLVNISEDAGGIAQRNNYDNMYWQYETFLTYNKTFNTDHRVNGVFGLSWQENTYRLTETETKGFPDDFYRTDNMGAGTNPRPTISKFERWRLNSYFVRAGYTYLNRYMTTFTARLDGSSRVGKNNPYGLFPSLGLGWLVSNERFMQENLPFISQLKLRTSYGLTGNTEIDPYKSKATIASGTSLINGSRFSSTYVRNLSNPDLKWEKTQQFAAGFNLNFLRDRIAVEFDYYYKLTSDLLLDRPVPHSTGFESVIDNIGQVSNRGIDLLITSRNIQTKDLFWESTLNLNYNKNKIEKLGKNDEDILPGPWWVSGSQTILRVGESLSSFYGYRRLGTWSEQEVADAKAKDPKSDLIAGTAKRSTDKEIIGKGLPNWTGSLVNRVQYKNFDFVLDLQFVMGGEILQQFFHSSQDRTGLTNSLSSVLYDAWTPSNQNTMVQIIRNAPLSGQSTELDDHWVSSASYLRVNGITFGYTLAEKELTKLGLNRARIYLSLNNMWVFNSKDFKGYDPEGTSQGDNKWGQNMFFYQYPKPRTFTIGMNINF